MSNLTAYIILIIAVALGTASNGFAKAANGFTIFLDCSIDVIINRIGDNIKSRPLLSSNYKIELGEIYESRKDKYKESAHLTINTDKYSKEILVEKIYNKINV